MYKSSISLIVPAYNEEFNIQSAIEQNIKVLKENIQDYEIIIIDDGSTDRTKEIIKKNFIPAPDIIFFSKPNGGFGSTIKKGIELCTKEYIIFAPVDSPLDKKLLEIFCTHLGKADILVSYRMARKGYSSRMKMNSGIYHFIISKLFHLSLKDYNWIQIYRRKIFEKIFIENERIFMLAEVLIKAKKEGFTFYEFPVEMQERTSGRRTAASYKAAIITFKDLFAFYLRNIFKKKT